MGAVHSRDWPGFRLCLNCYEESARETAEILADPTALRGLAEAREAEQNGDVTYGTEAAGRAVGAPRCAIRIRLCGGGW